MRMSTEQKIEEILYSELGGLLPKFLLMCCKCNGERYPLASLISIFMAFQCILYKEQGKQVKQLCINKPSFDIRKNPFFIDCKKSLVIAMEHSRDAGANKKRRKVDALIWEQELLILNHELHQSINPRGCQMRFAFFCSVIFLIWGNKEIYKLQVDDFSVEYDQQNRKYLRYF